MSEPRRNWREIVGTGFLCVYDVGAVGCGLGIAAGALLCMLFITFFPSNSFLL
jgi:hypothetical protein